MKILIVDDSKVMRMMVQRSLKQAGFGDHAVVEAGDGLEALELLRQGGVDVVLCDWNMPRMSGIQLLAAVKSENIDVRFGFVTSEGTAGMRTEASESGAEFLVAKPFTLEAFKSALGGVLAA